MRHFLLAALLAAAPALAEESALDTAHLLLKHLAEGNLAEAAVLSNAPKRRFELLRAYRDAIGEEEFKRVYSAYLTSENPLVAEVTSGRHRLLIWNVQGADRGIAGQYYVEVDGRFLLDDLPSRKRDELRKVLQAYRAGKSASP